MHGRPFLRIAAEFEDDFAAEYAVAPVTIAEGVVVGEPRGCDIAVSSQ